ncbi:MAG: DEAD/DEAH box helicase [Ignavibacteriaceae bacterium]|nr:DEAD/DEAH box helicase [Ignavibacteriaceae bacterium]
MLKEILNKLVGDTIRKRGRLYYLRGAVSKLKYSSRKATAIVEGTFEYNVEIEFDENKFPVSCDCTCPYNEGGSVCKHIVAVLYKLDEIKYFEDRVYLSSDPKDINSGYYGQKLSPQKLQTQGLTYVPDNESAKVKLQSKNREQWLAEIAKQKEAAKFSEFKKQIDVLVNKENKKSSIPNYKIAYAVEPKGYYTKLYALRQKIKKDGSTSDLEVIYTPNFENLPETSLQEKLIIERISKYVGEFLVDLYPSDSYRPYSNDQLNKSRFFSEILPFLSDREVYLYDGYKKIEKRLYISNDPGTAELLVDEEKDRVSLKLRFYFKGEQIKTGTRVIPILGNPLWVMVDENIFRISNLTYYQFYNLTQETKNNFFPKAYLEYFEENLLPQLVKNLPVNSDKYKVEEISSLPQKRIYLEEDDSHLKVIFKFAYNEYEVNFNSNEPESSFYKTGKIVRILRDSTIENKARQEIKEFHLKEIEDGVFTPRKDPVDFLFGAIPVLKEMGYEIFGESGLRKYKVNTSKPSISFAVNSGIDWFDVTTDIRFNGAAVPFEALLSAIKHKREYIKLDDGSLGILPQQWIDKFKRAFAFADSGNDQLRFSKFQVNALDGLIKEAEEVETDNKYKENLEQLNSFKKIQSKKIPSDFDAVLRPYQKSGFDWLYFLKDFGFGGILADDMGLGKTIQVLALLLNEKRNRKKTINLVIAPTSVVFNWLNEAEKFAPALKILNHTGNGRVKENALHFKNYDVILTSYPIVLRDIAIFKETEFNYIVLDESQKIKNPVAKTSKLIRTLNAKHRLCLTGTPIENNLNELWSQLTFLNPGMLGSLNKFQEAFIKPIQKINDTSATEYLKKTIYPFILRRTKDVVAKELPLKSEIIHYCEMDPVQQNIYNVWRDSIRDEITKEIEKKGIKRSGFKVIEGLLRLRQICNHPSLVKNNYKGKSGKFEEFKELLEKALIEGHKVLVFSQFVSMLDILKVYLDKEKILHEYLTGNTKDRESCVNNFQNNDNIKVFLISLKAGGFGLNLTAADYVFHYDPWWNPAAEIQATDRAHRIGQNKNVFVYKFITKDSVEEKILHLQEKKKKLVENIITSETGILKNLTKNDINILFS